MNRKPLVSVITVCYNAEKCILETLKSVSEQTYENIEYIIIDGKSQDSTLSIVREYFSDKQCNVRIISEPDSGIYDAMNKGISLATGDWVNFMNAGDKFATNDIIADIFGAGTPTCDVLYGDYIISDNGFYKLYKAGCANKLMSYMPFCHQSVFCSRSLLAENRFNCNYKSAGDYDLFVRLFLLGKKFDYVSVPISVFSKPGVSSNKKLVYREIDMVLSRVRQRNRSLAIKLCRIKEQAKERLKRIVIKIAPTLIYAEKRGWHDTVEQIIEKIKSDNV